MWIAACDDDSNFGRQIIKNLDQIVSKDDQITFFDNGLELIEAVHRSKHPIDLLLLDIEMPGLSGIDLANELRKISPGTIIVIITGFMQYALKCYEIRAFNYLLKPINIDMLKSTINDVKNRIVCANKNVLHIETRENHVFLPFCDVIYVESYCRALYAHTRGTVYKYYRKISDVENDLQENGFYRIHKSYLVNLSHIKRLDKSSKTIVLSTEESLPVGKRNVRELVSLLIDIRRNSYGNL